MPLCPVTPDSPPLTEAQEGLWYAQALDPANPILNTGQYLELLGPLDRDAMAAAVARTIAESPALSLRFADPGNGPRQAGGLPPMPGGMPGAPGGLPPGMTLPPGLSGLGKKK